MKEKTSTKMTVELEQQMMASVNIGQIVKFLIPQLVPFLPAILTALTAKVKNPLQIKIITNIAVALGNIGAKDETAVKQAWRAVRDAISNYLGE